MIVVVAFGFHVCHPYQEEREGKFPVEEEHLPGDTSVLNGLKKEEKEYEENINDHTDCNPFLPKVSLMLVSPIYLPSSLTYFRRDSAKEGSRL